MTETEPKDWKIVYRSRTRYHTPKYPYRIALEDRGEKLVICHQGIIDEKWITTHSIGLKRRDLTTMLKATKK